MKRITARGKAGGGIGGLFKGIAGIFGPKDQPEMGFEPGIAPGAVAVAPPPKTWMQKNWGIVAGGGAAVLIGVILLARARKK